MLRRHSAYQPVPFAGHPQGSNISMRPCHASALQLVVCRPVKRLLNTWKSALEASWASSCLMFALFSAENCLRLIQLACRKAGDSLVICVQAKLPIMAETHNGSSYRFS